MSRIFDVTLYFQNVGYDVCQLLATACAAASDGCPLACRARVMSLAHCLHHSASDKIRCTFVVAKCANVLNDLCISKNSNNV